jgi:RNA polymerase sigma factor (sigma-70 family)
MNKGEKIRELERLLRHYKTYKTGILNAEKQLEYLFPSLIASYEVIEGKGAFILSSSTEKAVLDRLESKKALDIHETIHNYTLITEAIDKSLEDLEEKEREFVKLRYIENMSVNDVSRKLRYSEKNVFKIRKRTLEKLLISLCSLVDYKF